MTNKGYHLTVLLIAVAAILSAISGCDGKEKPSAKVAANAASSPPERGLAELPPLESMEPYLGIDWQECTAGAEQTVRNDPDNWEMWYSWGYALLMQARLTEGAAADALYTQTNEKFTHALSLHPDYPLALMQWGHSLQAQAQCKEGAERESLLQQAKEKYDHAEKLKQASPTRIDDTPQPGGQDDQ